MTDDGSDGGRPHVAGLVEDQLNAALVGVLSRRGWRHRVLPFVGYGSPEFVRVLGRVVLASRDGERYDPEQALLQRGWRNFVTAEAPRVPISVTIDGRLHRAEANRSGTIDVRVPHRGLRPGWHQVTLQTEQSDPVRADVVVIDPECGSGIVSDLDDTVISTLLPRPLIAAYNTFWAPEQARHPVKGMAEFYAAVLAERPGSPVVYVSTGAWNTAGTLRRFLRRHRFPSGPMLLTDWGPTNTGWFRSGQDHKRACLASLADDFPEIAWLLVGDDGQHDPDLYREFAAQRPGHVRAIAIRELGLTEQVLTTRPPALSGRAADDLRTIWAGSPEADAVVEVSGRNGHELADSLGLGEIG